MPPYVAGRTASTPGKQSAPDDFGYTAEGEPDPAAAQV